MTVLHARLLGGLALAWDGTPLPPIPGATTRSLLAYLLTYREHPHTRDLLAGTFWPDLPDSVARRRLSQALWQIRSALSPHPILLTEGDTVQLNPALPLWTDVQAFVKYRERCVKGGEPAIEHCEQCLEQYGGEFLAGYYDDWVLVERERLREMYLATLECLVALHKQAGNHEQALVCAQRLTTADPLRESAHLDLMRLYCLLGRPQAALAQFSVLCELLAEELGISPTPTAVALYRDISRETSFELENVHSLQLTPPPLLHDLARLPLVGRTTERSTLLAPLQAAIQGRGGVVLVEGDAGVGKTRLIEEVIANAEWRGIQIGLGRATHLTASAPYQVLIDALSSLLTPLRIHQLAEVVPPQLLNATARLFPTIVEHMSDGSIALTAGLPSPPSADPQAEQQRLWEGLAHCLIALTTSAPLLIVLEDLHWADEATLTALPHLVERLPTSRALMILSCRIAEAQERPRVGEAFDALDLALPLLRLRLAPLEQKETTALVQQALATDEADVQTTELAQRLQVETGGNVLFVVETLKSLLERGGLAPLPDGRWCFPAQDQPLLIPTSIQELIAERLSHVAPKLRATLELVAVVGEEVEYSVLCRASDAEPAQLADRLGKLCRRGYLAETLTGYRFEHDLVRDVVYRALSPRRRQNLHARAGEALEMLHPEQVERLAQHFRLGQVWSKAVPYHWRAGEQAAAVHAYPEALTHYDHAIALSDAAHLPDPQCFELLAARESTLNILGQREKQADDLETMARLAQDDPRRLLLVYQRRAWLLVRTSRFVEAESVAQQALASARQLGDETQQAAALTTQGTAIYQRGDMAQAVPILKTASTLYRRLGDLQGEAEAQRALASAHHGTSNYSAAHEAAARSLELCEATDNPAGQADVLSLFGTLYMEQGATGEAIARYRQALEICRAIGYSYVQAKCWTNLGNAHYFGGQIAETLRCYDEAITLFTSLRDRRGEAFVRANAATVRHMISGDDETAARDAEVALAIYAQAGDEGGKGQCLDTLGGIALRRGDLAQARQQLEAALAAMRAAGDRWGEISVRRSLADLTLAEDQPHMALEHLEIAITLCQELDLAERAVVLQAGRGKALLALDQPEAALSVTAEAMNHVKPGVEQAYQIPFVHYQALTALGRNSEAHEAIKEAHQMLSVALSGLDSEQRKMSVQQVPEHRAIVAAWEASQPQQIVVCLPRVGAPTGRPLRDDEYVSVRWTVIAPEDEQVPGKAVRRHCRLRRLLREAADQGAAPTVGNLAEALSVSRATVKRDLAALRRAGYEVETRGSRK